MAFYIASDKPLPLVEWQKDAPAFHVEELRDEQKAVREQFTRSNVYYVGGWEGCGCSFNYGREYPEFSDDPDELNAAHEDRKRLFKYLKEHQVPEMYSCWFDEEEKPRKHIRQVTSDQLQSDEFVFQQNELLEIETALSQSGDGVT